MNSREASRKSRQSRNTVFRNTIIKTNRSLCQNWTMEIFTTHSKIDKDEDIIPAGNTSQLQLAAAKM